MDEELKPLFRPARALGQDFTKAVISGAMQVWAYQRPHSYGPAKESQVFFRADALKGAARLSKAGFLLGRLRTDSAQAKGLHDVADYWMFMNLLDRKAFELADLPLGSVADACCPHYSPDDLSKMMGVRPCQCRKEFGIGLFEVFYQYYPNLQTVVVVDDKIQGCTAWSDQIQAAYPHLHIITAQVRPLHLFEQTHDIVPEWDIKVPRELRFEHLGQLAEFLLDQSAGLELWQS